MHVHMVVIETQNVISIVMWISQTMVLSPQVSSMTIEWIDVNHTWVTDNDVNVIS